MKKLAILLCLIPGLACATNWSDEFYGGFRVGGRNMGFKSNYGDKLFAKNLVQYSVFGGTQFTENFGAEVSLFTTQDKKRSVNVTGAQTVLGRDNFSNGNNDSYNTKTRLSGATLQATARCPVWKCLDVYGSAGLGYGRMKLKADMTERNGATPTAAVQSANSFDVTSSKFYPVVGAGVDYRLAKNFGVRADIGYEGTQVFKKSFQTAAGNNDIKAKGSFVYGLSAYLAM